MTLYGKSPVMPPTSPLSQVCFHLTFMNIRAAVCTRLVALNGCIMSRNKRAFLCREEPTWGEKSTPWATERAGRWMPIWRSRDGGNARHTLLSDTIWPRALFTKKRLTLGLLQYKLTLEVWLRPPSGLKGGPQGYKTPVTDNHFSLGRQSQENILTNIKTTQKCALPEAENSYLKTR